MVNIYFKMNIYDADEFFDVETEISYIREFIENVSRLGETFGLVYSGHFKDSNDPRRLVIRYMAPHDINLDRLDGHFNLYDVYDEYLVFISHF